MSAVLDEGVQRYLRALPSPLSRRPDAVAVLRVDDIAGGGFWRLVDFTLTLVPGPDSLAHRVELDTRALTIGGLATTLVAQGYTTSTPDPAIAPLSTAILAEERGAPFAGRAFLGIATSALWRIFVPVALEGRALREDAETAIEQLDARLAFGLSLIHI